MKTRSHNVQKQVLMDENLMFMKDPDVDTEEKIVPV